MAEQELVENALQRIAGVLPDQSHRDLLKELLDQWLERAAQRRRMSSKIRISMGENCGKQDTFRDGVCQERVGVGAAVRFKLSSFHCLL